VKLVWSRLARDQAAQAVALMAAERPSAATEWLEGVAEKARSLVLFPDMGRMVPELQRPMIREVLVAPYRIIYRRDEAEVVILAVHHSRRELGAAPLGRSDAPAE
jgi:toxin ParE1/3/4